MKINTAQIVSDCSFVQYFSKCCPYVSTLPISSGDSRFRGFLPTTRSQQKISRDHVLDQDFLNLKINQFFEKLVRESFFLKGKEYTSTPASIAFIFFKSFDFKLMCNLAFT